MHDLSPLPASNLSPSPFDFLSLCNITHSETAGPDAVRAFLESQKYPQDKINLVVDIVAGVSFKNELGKKPGELRVFPELAVVLFTHTFSLALLLSRSLALLLSLSLSRTRARQSALQCNCYASAGAGR